MSPKADTFEAIYRAHAPSVFRRARNLLGSEDDAHEIVSDVFLNLYERPEQYQGRSALSTFLYSVTTNACLTRIRNGRKRMRLLEKEAAEAPVSARHPLSPESSGELRRLLEKMPEPLGHVAVYYYLDELTHDEIAEILGCSRRHVGNLLVRLGEWSRTEVVGS